MSKNVVAFSEDTFLLTKKWYKTIKEISEMKGKSVFIWDWDKFSKFSIEKENVDGNEIKHIEFSNGKSIVFTWNPISKNHLNENVSMESIEKFWRINLPFIDGWDYLLSNPYINWFFTWDWVQTKKGKKFIPLYWVKYEILKDKFPNFVFKKSKYREMHKAEIPKWIVMEEKFFIPDINYPTNVKLDWFAWYVDADWYVSSNKSKTNVSKSLAFSSVNKEFIYEVQRMLETMWIASKVKMIRGETTMKLPKNHYKGTFDVYKTQKLYRLNITSFYLDKLNKLWLKTHRLNTNFDILEKYEDYQKGLYVKVENISQLKENNGKKFYSLKGWETIMVGWVKIVNS